MFSEAKQLDDQQRQRIEVSLANYNIPFQILEKVAEKCGSKIDARSFITRGSGEKARRFSCLNNETILLLQRMTVKIVSPITDLLYICLGIIILNIIDFL
jgi:hypothetical protein